MKNNIRALRKGRGWTMEQLAERIEGSPHYTTIAKLERNERGLSLEWMRKIATALEVQPEDLFSSDPARRAVRMVPLIGEIAAGNWKEAVHDPIGYVPAISGGPRVFGLKTSGDSMNRVIMENAYLLVDPDMADLVDGKIYAVRNEQGEATVKFYRPDPPRLEPASTNPAHKPIFFGQEPFTIIGRVIWQGQEL